jgi:hypothetical protein
MDCIKPEHRARQAASQDSQQATEINGVQIDSAKEEVAETHS